MPAFFMIPPDLYMKDSSIVFPEILEFKMQKIGWNRHTKIILHLKRLYKKSYRLTFAEFFPFFCSFFLKIYGKRNFHRTYTDGRGNAPLPEIHFLEVV